MLDACFLCRQLSFLFLFFLAYIKLSLILYDSFIVRASIPALPRKYVRELIRYNYGHPTHLHVVNFCCGPKLAQCRIIHCCRDPWMQNMLPALLHLMDNCGCFRLVLKAHLFGCCDLWLFINSPGYWVVCVAGERSSTGLLEWESKTDALEALVMANHTPLPNPSMWHFLCFVNIWMNW